MDSVKTVNSRIDLIRFIQELKADLEEHGSDWENPTLEQYLDSMAAWLEDIGGWQYANKADMARMNPWQLFANILMSSRTYV